MSKKKKLEKVQMHLFYLIGTKERPFENPRLYAITDNKEFAEEFWNSRNQKLFFKVKKDIDDALELKKMMDRFKSMILTKTYMETRSDKCLGKRTKLVPFVCTRQEEERLFIASDRAFDEVGKKLGNFPSFPSSVFTSEIQEILDAVQLKKFYQSYAPLPFTGCSGMEEFEVGEALFAGAKDFSINEQLNIRVDQLGLFVHLYQDVLP